MNMKSTLFAGLLAASLSVPAFASDTHTATPLPQFSAADTQMLFAQDTMPMQLAVLSQQEMIETEGAVWQHGVGGLAGGYGAGHGYLAGGGSSPWGFLGSVAAGTAAGVWSPVNGIRSGVMTFGGSFSGGAVGGFGSSRGWW